MSDFSSLNIAKSGLDAHAKRLSVIGDNIANIDTEGYTRRRVDLEPIGTEKAGVYSGSTAQHGGVSSEEVSRLRNELLSNHARTQAGVAADRGQTVETLQELEQVLGGLDDNGLRTRLTEFFNSFDDLANAPEDPAMRSVVLQRAESVANGFTQTAGDVDDLQGRMTTGLQDQVRALNELASEVAELNGQIMTAIGADSSPNALLDRRDLKVDQMAKLADIQVIESAHGQIIVSLDGRHLVNGDSAMTVAAELQTHAALGALGYQYYTVVDSQGREMTIGNGELAATIRSITQLVPDARTELDNLRDDLITQVNALHTAGTGLDGSTGLNMFEAHPTATSGGLIVSADVAGQPEKIAAAAAGAGDLDAGNADALAELADSTTGPVAAYIAMVTDLAATVNTAEGAAGAADAASALADNLALAAGGVSLDQELTDLISAQRAYEASARMMTAIDEMLQTLINRTGIVGR
ncbi:MAG: flagellar hook-associated protein FlgK [Actinomycetota bacterium]